MTAHKIDMGYELLRSIKYLGNYKIDCEFENGETGIFDLVPYLERGIFKKLKDEEYAATVRLESGVLSWGEGHFGEGDCEIDLAPERVYFEIIGKLSDRL